MKTKKGTQEDIAEKMENLLIPVIRAMVDYPDEVEADITVSGKSIIVEVWCIASDLKYLIGREGTNADSLRFVFGAISQRTGYRLFLTLPNVSSYKNKSYKQEVANV